MKAGVVGGRTFNDYEVLCETLDEYKNISLIVSGGRRKDGLGADTLAIRYAKERDIPFKEHYPDWDKHGNAAGPIRNKLIVDDIDIVFAFWDMKSPGTKSTIQLAREAKKRVVIIDISHAGRTD